MASAIRKLRKPQQLKSIPAVDRFLQGTEIPYSVMFESIEGGRGYPYSEAVESTLNVMELEKRSKLLTLTALKATKTTRKYIRDLEACLGSA